MKIGKKLLIILITILAIGFVENASAKVKFAPYYSLEILEGFSIPSKGEYALTLNLTNDMGLLAKIDDKHSVMGFYELKYLGPGFRRQEGDKFTDRFMDHIIVARHQFKINEQYTLKSQLNYMQEFKRTGTNEIWGQGLYDYNKMGIGFTLERIFSDMLTGDAYLGYYTLKFPNYTDLLTEFQTGGENVESSTGKQDHTMYQLGTVAEYGPYKGSLDLILMNYDKQKVIVDSAQSDGTYYSGTLQQDMLITFDISHVRSFMEKIIINPSLSFKIKTSNQNYQHFETATSSVPVRYFGKYYDYNQLVLALPCTLLMSSKWEYFLNIEWDWKMYGSRPPRDSDGNFVSGTQGNTLMIWTTGFTFKPNDITRTTLIYSYQGQTSNMKYEDYLPYNYDGHYIGISFHYLY